MKSDGSTIGGNFRISGAAATNDEYDPAVAYNPALNQYLVVWTDYRNLSTLGYDIYGQRVRAGGTMAGGNFRVSGWSATNDEINPAVAYGSTVNRYLVVWSDSRNASTRGFDIYGQRVRG